ncbi:hypothetical protein [Metabacillus halosaccharovorans]|uniref:hypothetical protein n=1 Tax=Metabacillus halosaccharovorans TaxID=930124 RepID=UPI001C1F6A5D|nr:hypothetical protein [Metabacillus halosaccharovorans]MBU7591467.1 hypothetical protein [Metabacillus halosaccharovorans]
MKKILHLVGAFVLVLLLIQSTIGIINYSSSGSPQGFPDRGRLDSNGGGSGFSGTPPQNSEDETDSTNTSGQEDTMDPSTRNDQMQMTMGQQDRSSFSSILRSFENGITGLVVNCLSLGLAICWILLYCLARKKQQTQTI